MKPRIYWAWFLGVALTACGSVVVPIPPPTPVPVPVPPEPTPVPVPGEVATWAGVEAVREGMTRAEVTTALGVSPRFDSVQDDGTRIAEYAAVDAAGKPIYLDVRFSASGVVIGRSTFPRAAPTPVSRARLLIEPECKNGVCAVPELEMSR